MKPGNERPGKLQELRTKCLGYFVSLIGPFHELNVKPGNERPGKLQELRTKL